MGLLVLYGASILARAVFPSAIRDASVAPFGLRCRCRPCVLDAVNADGPADEEAEELSEFSGVSEFSEFPGLSELGKFPGCPSSETGDEERLPIAYRLPRRSVSSQQQGNDPETCLRR